MTRRPGLAAALLTFALGVVACGSDAVPDGAAPGEGDGVPVADRPHSGAATDSWPADPAAPVTLRRERAFDLTGDGSAETFIVTADGPAYDSLQIRLVIRTVAGDTLWADGWNSIHYFQYDPIDGRPAAEIARIVQAHVDTLLHESRFTRNGPRARAQLGNLPDLVGESVSYHLAELDWRNSASLRPSDPMPPGSYDRIDASRVAPARTAAVVQELMAGPTYSYYAGGEVSSIIGWSAREHSLVRLCHCC
jgi:hypothetical protein